MKNLVSFAPALLLPALVMTAGCESAESKKCSTATKGAQRALMTLNPGEQKNVESVVETLKEAKTVCEKAKRSADVKDIEDAMQTMSGHLKRLKEKPPEKKKAAPKPPSKEELEKLEKEGDPNCPAGQAYRHPTKPKELITCKGKTVMERSFKENVQLYAGFRFQLGQKGNLLRASQGEMSYTFHYDKADSEKAPLCLEIHPPAGFSWKQAVAQVTNVPAAKLKKDAPIPAEMGELALKVVEEDADVTITVGTCPPPQAAEAKAEEGEKKADPPAKAESEKK